ncbi:hypothetical protein [Bradyrhizobium sp.]|uniref:hypothetical protein n=1 Tax=Bradyrhizobium sp. TaxID=376 RepID=UPI002384C4AB|nr:hypothetical protein [Bradyrhizobium sp.]MDE2378835.1 hypothetical protein [Bradyrhizobium sp.]
MAEVINFPRTREHPAVRRLQGLTRLLSEMDGMTFQSEEDMRRALWILDLANRCVRVILSDFHDDPCISELIRQAEELVGAVERTRSMVDDLGSTLHTEPDTGRSLRH